MSVRCNTVITLTDVTCTTGGFGHDCSPILLHTGLVCSFLVVAEPGAWSLGHSMETLGWDCHEEERDIT